MDVTLPAHLEEMVRQKVQSGLYASPAEVVNDALRRMDELDYAKFLALREAIREGMESGAVEPFTADSLLQEIRSETNERT